MNQRTHFLYLFNTLQCINLTSIFYSFHNNLQTDKGYIITPGQVILHPDLDQGASQGSDLSSPPYLLCGRGQLNDPVPQFPCLWHEDNSAYLSIVMKINNSYL